jgi:hypothetical protein
LTGGDVLEYEQLLIHYFPDEGSIMNIDRIIRGIAGTFIIASLLLAHYHSINWLWFTGFVGLNLLQSGFTNWCPMFAILKKSGVPK